MFDFSLKFLRWVFFIDLDFVIRFLFYYFECYWKFRRKRMRIFFKLIMYVIAVGWVYQIFNVYYIFRLCFYLVKWLIQQMKILFIFRYLLRVLFRQYIVCFVFVVIDGFSYFVFELLKRYLFMEDVDVLCSLVNVNINYVSF